MRSLQDESLSWGVTLGSVWYDLDGTSRGFPWPEAPASEGIDHLRKFFAKPFACEAVQVEINGVVDIEQSETYGLEEKEVSFVVALTIFAGVVDEDEERKRCGKYEPGHRDPKEHDSHPVLSHPQSTALHSLSTKLFVRFVHLDNDAGVEGQHEKEGHDGVKGKFEPGEHLTDEEGPAYRRASHPTITVHL